MAGPQRAKTDFIDILSHTNRKFDIIHVKWSDDKFFEIKFRTQIERNNEDFNALCDEWVDLFSEITSTVWAKKISNTGPKIKFRKQYQCWTQGGKVIQKELLFDARRCKGTLDMKVLTDTPLTRKKNKHIRQGLNVVVKINFIHLHPVDITQPFAFFVHNCEPQAEAPKLQIQPNDRLPQLVAEMVQKGLNNYPKIPAADYAQPGDVLKPAHEELSCNVLEMVEKSDEVVPFSQETIQVPATTMHFIQNLPVQTLEGVKLEIQPNLQQFTQVVVTGSGLDMSLPESLVMCQPLMFDASSQIIPVTSHTLNSQFVQINNQQGQFL